MMHVELITYVHNADNLEELLDIFMDEFRQARIYLSMDNDEVPRAGLRLAGWQEMEQGHQDLIMSNTRLRLWLGDQYDRTCKLTYLW